MDPYQNKDESAVPFIAIIPMAADTAAAAQLEQTVWAVESLHLRRRRLKWSRLPAMIGAPLRIRR